MIKNFCIASVFVLAAPAAFGQIPASDAEIASALVTINEGEIDAGKIADGRAQSKDVKDYAKAMIDQHRENVTATKRVAKENGIKMKEGDLSRNLKDEAKKSNKELRDNEKITFDKAYMRQQITMHEKALKTLNETLIPNAKDAEFKVHLERTRDDVAKHLDHAKNIDSRIQ